MKLYSTVETIYFHKNVLLNIKKKVAQDFKSVYEIISMPYSESVSLPKIQL